MNSLIFTVFVLTLAAMFQTHSASPITQSLKSSIDGQPALRNSDAQLYDDELLVENLIDLPARPANSQTSSSAFYLKQLQKQHAENQANNRKSMKNLRAKGEEASKSDLAQPEPFLPSQDDGYDSESGDGVDFVPNRELAAFLRSRMNDQPRQPSRRISRRSGGFNKRAAAMGVDLPDYILHINKGRNFDFSSFREKMQKSG